MHVKVFVYFTTPQEPDPCQGKADVVRLPDTPPDFSDQGLLASISKTDLNATVPVSIR